MFDHLQRNLTFWSFCILKGCNLKTRFSLEQLHRRPPLFIFGKPTNNVRSVQKLAIIPVRGPEENSVFTFIEF